MCRFDSISSEREHIQGGILTEYKILTKVFHKCTKKMTNIHPARRKYITILNTAFKHAI